MRTTHEQSRVDRRVHLETLVANLPELAPHHLVYQKNRNALIPQAEAHAKAWAAKSPKSAESRMANHMEALAFSNQMQRMCWQKGLIGYDPERSRKWVSEEKLLRKQSAAIALKLAKSEAAQAAAA